MISLIVNGQPVSVPEGATVLLAVRAAGVELPTLCYHEGLSPYGACRLCMVTLAEPRQTLVAACAYPVQAGMVVDTDTPEATRARRLVMELLLGRCPQSTVIQELAAKLGVRTSRFPCPRSEGDREFCVLCGLCVRVCREAIGAAAIGFVGRGEKRKVDTPFEVHTEACVGCGACAEICPTSAIRIEDRGRRRILHTWHTQVELSRCPRCGRFFAPRNMAFLQERFPEVEPVWLYCPACRSQRAARQWVAQRPAFQILVQEK